MVLAAPTGEILARLGRAIGGALDGGWAAEPPAARLALLAREALERWVREAYPGSACEGAALDRDSRRRLSLTIHSPAVTHRVEIRGMACGDPFETAPPPAAPLDRSWVVLAHLGGPCRNFDAAAARIAGAGLRLVDRRDAPRLSLGLWMGADAPDGCPACPGTPPPG